MSVLSALARRRTPAPPGGSDEGGGASLSPPPAPPDPARGRALLGLVFLLTLPLVTPRLRAGDEIQYDAYLHSIFFDHDLEFGNEYQYFYDRNPQGLALFKGTFLDRLDPATGRHLNFTPVGTALLWSPFYVLAHLGVLGARALGAHVAADGLSRPYEAAACYASAVYGFLAVLLIHDALVRFGRYAEPVATGTSLALWLGTPLLYYTTLAPGFAHPVGLFTVALLLWLWLRAREGHPTLGAYAFMGAVGGLAALVREQVGLFVLVPALDAAWTALRTGQLRTGVLRLGTLAGAALAVFAPQLLVYQALNGHFGPSRLVTRKMTWWSPHALSVLVDPGHGLFLWTPLLLVATLGLPLAIARRPRSRGVFLALGLLLQLWMNGAIESWTQAGAFGSRRFIESTPVFAFGLAAVLAAVLPRIGRLATGAVLGLSIWWNVSLMVQWGLKLMDRQRLEWPRVAVVQVREVPRRLGHAAVLFFTDRERLVREAP